MPCLRECLKLLDWTSRIQRKIGSISVMMELRGLLSDQDIGGAMSQSSSPKIRERGHSVNCSVPAFYFSAGVFQCLIYRWLDIFIFHQQTIFSPKMGGWGQPPPLVITFKRTLILDCAIELIVFENIYVLSELLCYKAMNLFLIENKTCSFQFEILIDVIIKRIF